jgi:predicted flap endonuclease-1-like 5' DNA nuclease
LAEEKQHHERLRLRVHELEPFHGRFHEAEAKLHSETEASAQLRIRIDQIESSLEEEKKHRELLRLRVHELEPFHAKFHEIEKRLHSEAESAGKLRLAAREAEEKLADLRAGHAEASAQARGWEARFNQHTQETGAAIAVKDAEIARLAAHISELEALRNKLRQQDERLHEWDNRFSSTVGEKDGEITRLRFELGQLSPLRDEVTMLNSRLTTVVAEKDQEIENLRSQLQVIPVGEGAAAAPAKAPQKREKHEKDDLKQIPGIGSVLEKRLNAYGVHWFKQIALWTREDVDRFETHLPSFKHRAERDQWVAGAK